MYALLYIPYYVQCVTIRMEQKAHKNSAWQPQPPERLLHHDTFFWYKKCLIRSLKDKEWVSEWVSDQCFQTCLNKYPPCNTGQYDLHFEFFPLHSWEVWDVCRLSSQTALNTTIPTSRLWQQKQNKSVKSLQHWAPDSFVASACQHNIVDK